MNEDWNKLMTETRKANRLIDHFILMIRPVSPRMLVKKSETSNLRLPGLSSILFLTK